MSDDQLPVIYIGPNSSKLGLARLRQYQSLNPQIQAAIDEHPAMSLLFVPLDQFYTRQQQIYANADASINHAVLHLTNAGVL